MKKLRLLSGFTLIELLITLVIAGVLVAMAGPSFSALVEGFKPDRVVRRLADSFTYA
jgi:prepilin-type N-terminal cleavage/methylation domain-containing protein